ncbi:MAG: tetratricopeptide repeat protein [Rhodospirillales bacterium]|nr:MAG: tetratricopeptide repeat protein [Rhodospirillales bacterium]
MIQPVRRETAASRRAGGTAENGARPPEAMIRAALERVLVTSALKGLPRRAAFLRFVVEETLAGRAGLLKGFNIAVAVFGRDQSFDPQSDPVVRLEARQLRNDLAHYYLDAGRDDPVRIDMPKGGYVPTFEWNRPLPAASVAVPESAVILEKSDRRTRPILISAIVGAACLVAGVLGTWQILSMGSQDPAIVPRFTENSEAYAMFLETRQLGRPPNIEARVLAAMELAREVQALDPSFGGGYAAESFQYWQYIVFGHSDSPDADARRALELARKAIEIDPEFGWGYQSLSRALQLAGDTQGAIAAAEHAVDLDPANAEHLGNLGLALAASGRAADAIGPLEEAIRLSEANVRTPFMNYLGVARFHNREFAKAAETIERNRDSGGPVGPHMYAYLAATYAMAGNEGRARAFAEQVRAASSEFSVRVFIENLIHDTESRQMFFEGLKKAGLDPETL